jgi:hypothetical protein
MVSSELTVTRIDNKSGRASRAATWLFIPLWVIGNALGAAAGTAMSQLWNERPLGFDFIIPPIILCTTLALLQGTVLNLYLRRILFPWLFAGLALGLLMLNITLFGLMLRGMGASYLLAFLITACIASGLTGFWQSIILVGRVWHEGWWLPINVVAWAVAVIIEGYAGWHGIGYAFLGNGDVIQATVTTMIASTISGAGLAWLMSHPLQLAELNHGTPFALKEDSVEDKHMQTES